MTTRWASWVAVLVFFQLGRALREDGPRVDGAATQELFERSEITLTRKIWHRALLGREERKAKWWERKQLSSQAAISTPSPTEVTARKAAPRIAGGKPAPCGRYTYMASLRDAQNNHKCGGVLVESRWVLTAAHCVDPNDKNSLGASPIIVIGGCNLNDERTEAGDVEKLLPSRTIIHERWQRDVLKGADVALLELPKKSEHHPISLPSSNHSISPNEPLVVLGWGQTANDTTPEDLIQGTNVHTIPQDICSEATPWGDIIDDSKICAFGFNFEGDTCDGDSGGPLLRAFAPHGDLERGDPELDVLIGLTSFGEKGPSCGKSLIPGVYTSVAYYLDWLNQHLKGDNDLNPEGSRIKIIRRSPPQAQLTGPPSSSPEMLPPQPVPPAPAPPPKKVTLPKDSIPQIVPITQENGNAKSDSTSSGNPKERGKNGGGQSSKELFSLAAKGENEDNRRRIKGLLSKGVDPNSCCSLHGRSTLHATSKRDNADAALLLVQKGADVNVKDDQGQTALHLAAVRNAPKVAQVLVDAGANANETDNEGETPLHDAAEWGSVKVAEVLLNAGAIIDVRDLKGRTPYDAICSSSCRREKQQMKLEEMLRTV